MENKIKISELTKYGHNKGVAYCATEEEANSLLTAAAKFGATWHNRNGFPYTKFNNLEGVGMCYKLCSDWTVYQSRKYYKEKKIKIWNLDEIDLEN
jgi:hypothetical protein